MRDFDFDNRDHESIMQIEDKRIDRRLANLNPIQFDLQKHEANRNCEQKHEKSNNFN